MPPSTPRFRFPAAALAAAAIAAFAWWLPAPAATPIETQNETPVRIAMTGGLAETKLAQWLIEDFREEHPDVQVTVVSAGDAEVFDLGRESEADLLVTHHRPGEDSFMSEGWGRSRTMLMYGQYMIYGPPGDKLQLQGEVDIRIVMRKIADAGAPLRGATLDTAAGIRLAELWGLARIPPGKGDYTLVPGGSAKALQAAAEAGGYTLAEVGIFAPLERSLRDKLEPLARPTHALRDTYSLIAVSSERAPGVREKLADKLRDYLLSTRGQNRIGTFVPKGASKAMLFPAAGDDAGLAAERADGEVQWISLMLLVVSAVLVAVIGVAAALGARWRAARRSNRQHRKIEERLTLGLESASDGLWDWDRREGQVYLSRRFRQIARMSTKGHWFPEPEELWSRVVRPEHVAHVKAAVEAAFKATGSGRLDVAAQLDPANGDSSWIRIRGIAHRNRSGDRARIVGTIRVVDEKDAAQASS